MDELGDTPVSLDSVESVPEAKEAARMIEGFLDSMSTENRVIFMLRYAFYPYADIAERLGLSVKSVSVRLTRIRQRLRRYLDERLTIKSQVPKREKVVELGDGKRV